MDTDGRVWARTSIHMARFPFGTRRLVDPEDVDIQGYVQNGALVFIDEDGNDLPAASPKVEASTPPADPETTIEPEPPPQEPDEPGPEPDSEPDEGLQGDQAGEEVADAA